MVIYCKVWSSLVKYIYIWLCMVICGHVWSCMMLMFVYGLVRSSGMGRGKKKIDGNFHSGGWVGSGPE